MSQKEKNNKRKSKKRIPGWAYVQDTFKELKSSGNHFSGWFYVNVLLRVLKSLMLFVVALIVLGGGLSVGIGLGYFAYLVQDTPAPSKEELQQELGDITETSKLVYADDSQITAIRADLMRTSIPSEEISDLVKTAIIATEDEYFYEHTGVVPKAVLRALISEVTNIGSSGGSTLTQQLVKQQILGDETTFKRKANEILLAMEVEKNFSKDEIVSLYLNVSPFGRNNLGQNIAGIQEAAQGIFGVDPKDLNLPQAAFIAGLPQNPITYTPYTNTGALKESFDYGLSRKDFVLFSMYRNHDISKEEYEDAKAYDLVADFKPKGTLNNNERGFLYDTVMGEASKIVAKKLADEDNLSAEEFATDEMQQKYLRQAESKLANGGYTIKSTLDKNVHQAMQDTVAQYGDLLDNGSTIEVGNVLMENSTGRILGFVGGRDYSANQYNHAFNSKRQAGSAIKPVLVYAPAIDQGLIGTESRISDYPAKWRAGENKGEPIVNATNEGSSTFQSVRETIIHSNNIPAYHIYQNTLSKMGSKSSVYDTYLAKMEYPNQEVWQFESAPLGVPEITTLEQTGGFQTLANGGVYEEGYIIESITDSHGNVYYQHENKPVKVFSKATASIMNNLMRSVVSEGITTSFKAEVSSLSGTLGSADWVGKTGTTDAYVDSWLVVSTPNITLSSWSGREDNKANDEGASDRTARYMAQLANAIYQANPEVIGIDENFSLDPDVKEYEVAAFTGAKPGGRMTVDNTSITVPSETVTSYWAKKGPANVSFKFGIGGSEANYTNYWKTAIPAPRSNSRSNSSNSSSSNRNR